MDSDFKGTTNPEWGNLARPRSTDVNRVEIIHIPL